MNNIVVIGAGISGLSCAYYLKRKIERENRNINLIVLEKEDRVGGKIRTEKHRDFIFEAGPRGFLASGRRTLELSKELGIWDNLLLSNDTARTRYVFEDNNLIPLEGFSLIKSIGFRGFASILGEAFRKNKSVGEDESVYSFIERRFSTDIMERFVELMITGIYAGDSRKLSARAIFPKLTELEEAYGSIIKGFIKSKRDRGVDEEYDKEVLSISKRKLLSYNGGLQTITDALGEELKSNIKLSVSIDKIEYRANNGINIRYEQSGKQYDVRAIKVFCATPAYETARYLGEDIPALASILDSIEYAPMSVISMGFAEKVHNYRGFGFLSNRHQGLYMLGSIWNDMVFRGLAPEGMMNLTAMYGGAYHPSVRDWDEDKLVSCARKEFVISMNLKKECDIYKVHRYGRGIPQYNIGHPKKLSDISSILGKHRGIYLSGNYLNGIGMNDCIRGAFSLVKGCNLD